MNQLDGAGHVPAGHDRGRSLAEPRPGRPLDAATRRGMELAFGTDLGRIRIHDDPGAWRSAAGLLARAFTLGDDIVFGPGEYAPSTNIGRQLLAHEITHSIQQRQVAHRAPGLGTAIEAEASQAAAAVGRGEHVSVRGTAAGPGIDRQESTAPPPDPRTMSPEAIDLEVARIRQWLTDNRTAGPEYDRMAARLATLERAVSLQDAAGRQGKSIILPEERTAAPTTQPSTGGTSAPTPVVVAPNTLLEAIESIESIRPSEMASGLYEGVIQGKRITLDVRQYEQVRAKALTEIKRFVGSVRLRTQNASGRYEEQQRVDAHHWIVAPIVKGLGGVRDPGPSMRRFVSEATFALDQAQKALDAGDLRGAAAAAGTADAAAEKAARMVAAYVDQIISSAEMTVTVLEGVKTASMITLFVLSLVATGGASAAATSTVFGLEVGTAAAVTAITAGAAIAEEVGVGIVKAADGDNVDWTEIATHAVITAIVARFAPGMGGRVAGRLSGTPLIAKYGSARVVSIATSLIVHEGSQIFATTVDYTVKALRGKQVTWKRFGEELLARLTDPKGLFFALLSGALAGQPAGGRSGGGPDETAATGATGTGGKSTPTKTKTDNADWRDVNRDVGIKKTRAGTGVPTPKKGTTAADADDPRWTTEAVGPGAKTDPVLAAATKAQTAGKDAKPVVIESSEASPKGSTFVAARAEKASAVKTTAIPADLGEAAAYKAALGAGEIGLERPQGVNVAGRADFVTAVRDRAGKLWIVANDAKTLVKADSATASGMKPGWDAQVKAAVDRAKFEDPALGAEIRQAYAEGRVWFRKVTVDRRPIAGSMGQVSGLDAPPPTPLVQPVRLSSEETDAEKRKQQEERDRKPQ